MKLFVRVALEGATGVVSKMATGGPAYAEACERLTADLNAAIEGAVESGVKEVVVCEGPWPIVSLTALHPMARLVRGRGVSGASGWLPGLDSSFDMAFFVGAVSRAGTENGLLSYTWDRDAVHEVTLDGRAVGHVAIDAALCGDYGVPVALVTGDDDVAREALDVLGEVETAVVKRAMGPELAECWGPTSTAKLVRRAAQRAVARFEQGAFRPLVYAAPVVAEVSVSHREIADLLLRHEGIERMDSRRVRTTASDARGALGPLRYQISDVASANQ